MKTNTVSTILILLGICLLAGCAQEVQTGDIVVCKHCGQQVSNTVRTIKVPFWKADEYQVTKSFSYCEKCGSEPVTYQIKFQCQQCGEIYQTFVRTAERRYEPRDSILTMGYCSSRCENWAKVDKKIDQISEKTGDVLGRIGKGVYEGIKKHAK